MTLFNFLGQLSLTLVVLFFAVFVPGWLFMRKAALNITRLEKTIASLLVGMVLFTLVAFILGYAGFLKELWVYVALANALALWEFKQKTLRPSLAWDWCPEYTVLLILAAFGALAQGSLHYFSGWESAQGSVYHAFHGHDAPWHVYNIYQFAMRFPAEMPGFAHEPLKNYHFLADFFWGEVKRLAPSLNAQHLYFRMAPTYNSLLLSFTTFMVATRLSGNKRTGLLATGLTVFTAGFGYLLPLFTGKAYFVWDSLFWLQPPFSLLYNPGVAVSLFLILAGVWGAMLYWQDKQRGALIFTGLVWGVLIGFKVYAGLIVFAGLVGMSVLYALFKKENTWLKLLAAFLPVALLIFLPVNSSSGSLVRFFPGYALATMIAAPDRLNLMSYDALRALFLQHPILFALFMLLLVVVFVVGNLGVKTLGVWPVVKCFAKPFDSPFMSFIGLMSIVSLGAPLVLIQYGLQWQTIQFGYYAILFAAIPAAMELQHWLGKMHAYKKVLVIALVFLLGIPCVIQSMIIMRWENTISPAELEAWSYMRTQPQSEGIVIRPLVASLKSSVGQNQLKTIFDHGKMLNLSDFKRNAEEKLKQKQESAAAPSPIAATPVVDLSAPKRMLDGNFAYLAGMCQRNSYLEDIVSSQIMGHPVEQRIQDVIWFFGEKDATLVREFMLKHSIHYVILFDQDQMAVDMAQVPLQQVFQNQVVRILEFVPTGFAKTK